MTHKATAAVILACVLVFIGIGVGWAGAQVMIPRAEDLRFQLVSSEPIATPDRQSVVAGYSAVVVKDVRTGQCYVGIAAGDAMGVTPIGC